MYCIYSSSSISTLRRLDRVARRLSDIHMRREKKMMCAMRRRVLALRLLTPPHFHSEEHEGDPIRDRRSVTVTRSGHLSGESVTEADQKST